MNNRSNNEIKINLKEKDIIMISENTGTGKILHQVTLLKRVCRVEKIYPHFYLLVDTMNEKIKFSVPKVDFRTKHILYKIVEGSVSNS